MLPRRIADYDPNAGWNDLNLLATIGGFTIAFSILPFLWNVFITFRSGEPAGDDPWGGNTLEWATSSPPPAHNFDVIPEVRDRDPLWYNRDHGIALPPRPEHLHIHMPPPSYFPLIIALGVLALAVGGLSHLALVPVGVAVIIYGVWGWALEPTS